MKYFKRLFLTLLILGFTSNLFALGTVRLGPSYFPETARGRPVALGSIYVGQPDLDPSILANQKQLSVRQESGTVVTVSQPISTSAGGIPLYLGSPVTLLVDGYYSLKVLDSSGTQVYYVPSSNPDALGAAQDNCYPDYNAVNQGLTGDNDTIKYCVDTYGSDQGTIVLRHNSGSATTPYTLTTSETIPANITLKVERGAVIDGAGTLTFTSPKSFISGINYTFGSSVTITGPTEVYPEWWGENTAPGTTDMTAEINSAATCAGRSTNNGIVKLQGTVYKVSSDMTFPKGVSLIGEGIDNTIIDNSSIADLTLALLIFQGDGLTTIEEDVTNAIAAGDLTITMGSAPSVVAGDLLVVRNDADSSWNPARTYYRQGEFVIVKSVAGSVITLTTSMIDSYATTAFDVYKVNPTIIEIGNFSITGNSAATGNDPSIWVTWARDSYIHDIKFLNSNSTGVYLKSGYNCNIERIETGKYIADAGSIQAAGVLVEGQYITVRDCVLNADRHGASTGGGAGGITGTDPTPTDGYGVSRFITFKNNHISSRSNYAADFHGNAEFCTYENNHIDGGVNLSGARNKLIDNDIYPGTNATMINWEAMLTVDFTVNNNTFHGYNSAYIIDANDTTDINANTDEAGTFKFWDNEIIDTYAGNRTYLFIRNNGSTADNRFSFKRNIIKKTNTGFSGTFLAMSVVTGTDFSMVEFENNTLINTGIGIITDLDDWVGSNNSINIPNFNSAAGSITPDRLRITDDFYRAENPPSFSTGWYPSTYTFFKTLDLATPATSFLIYSVAGFAMIPIAVQFRADTDITATNGNYFGIGVTAANRRVDFGVSVAAAADSKHSRNAKGYWLSDPSQASQQVESGKSLSLISTVDATDAAALGSNIGGAGETLTVSAKIMVIGNLTDAP